MQNCYPHCDEMGYTYLPHYRCIRYRYGQFKETNPKHTAKTSKLVMLVANINVHKKMYMARFLPPGCRGKGVKYPIFVEL